MLHDKEKGQLFVKDKLNFTKCITYQIVDVCRCSMDTQCIAYHFHDSTTENCGLIYENSTAESGNEFTSDRNLIVFWKGDFFCIIFFIAVI